MRRPVTHHLVAVAIHPRTAQSANAAIASATQVAVAVQLLLRPPAIAQIVALACRHLVPAASVACHRPQIPANLIAPRIPITDYFATASLAPLKN